ncbi:MAG: AMP-binding enzyme family protein [Rhodospirillales bacterium]|nr:AMP-binding enzyme family protein [Rhodospirillales bacterium]
MARKTKLAKKAASKKRIATPVKTPAKKVAKAGVKKTAAPKSAKKRTYFQPPYYDEALDFRALRREYPASEEYWHTTHLLSRDELHSIQNKRFRATMKRGWQVPFYDKHWRKHGLEPGDIRSIEDIEKVPMYTVHDLRDAMGTRPPYADYIGLDPEKDPPMAIALQTSGGTTGLPRPMLYSAKDRELFSLFSSRGSFMRSVMPFDLVQVTMAMGLPNGGMQAREAIWKYTGALGIMTGTGSQTPTRRQIEILRGWKVNHLNGWPAYLRHMAQVARDEMGFDVRDLKLKSIATHLGVDSRDDLEEMWGTKVWDGYGSNECGAVAVQCQHRTGMHVFEDGFAVSINDPDSGKPVAHGERGNIVLTALWKELGPVIRYNTNDVSAIIPVACACGGTPVRMDRMFGRSDNMVKVRGVNVFPEAIGAVIGHEKKSNGEFICVVDLVGSDRREELTVMVETFSSRGDSNYEKDLASRLKESIGVQVLVEAVEIGKLEELTGVSTETKVKRLLDKRKK